MAANDYEFVTRWRVEGTIEEISEVLSDALDLPRWWPSVYLEVDQLDPGDDRGVGRVISLYMKGWLPYTLRWQFRVTESRHPHGLSLEAWGDFVGTGVWTVEQGGAFANVTYEWAIRPDKPLLRAFSFLLKPIFAANHRWAMEAGERSLKIELARRHARTPEERLLVPDPPGPTPTSPVPFILGPAAAIFALRRIARGRRG